MSKKSKTSSKATEPDYDSMKVLALKDLCKKRKIPTNGLKSEIVKRLKAFDKKPVAKSSKTAPVRKTKKVVEESEEEPEDSDEPEEEISPPKKSTKTSKTKAAKKPVKKTKAKVAEPDEDEEEDESEEKPKKSKGKAKVAEPESEVEDSEVEEEESEEEKPKKSKGKAKVVEPESEVEEVEDSEVEEESEEKEISPPKKSKAKKGAAKAKGSKKAKPVSEEEPEDEEDEEQEEDQPDEEPEDEEIDEEIDEEEKDEAQDEEQAEPSVDLIAAIIDKDVVAYRITPKELASITYKAISAAASSRDIEVDLDGLREVYQQVSNALRPFGIAKADQLAALKKAGHTKLVPGTRLISVGPKQAPKNKKATPKTVAPKEVTPKSKKTEVAPKTPQKGVKPNSPKAPQKSGTKGPIGSKSSSPKSAKPKEKEEDNTLQPMQIEFDKIIGAYCMGEFAVDFTTKSVVGRVTGSEIEDIAISPLDPSDIPYFIENKIRFILIQSQKELDEILAKNREQYEADKPSQGEGEADGIEIPTGDEGLDAENDVDEGLDEITDPAAPQIDEDKFTRFVAVQLGTANQLDYTAIAKEAGLTDLEGQQIMVNYKAYFDKYPHAVVDATVKKVPVKGPGGQKPVKAGRKMLKK